ncbi:hypothetical protein QQS21_000439 [Conoideocrella luteorostrata]|uniref:Uncharacterized protein n=1 Tax=Conoideocrella luteorostrata TaxID=1105319 RepID=A0AAJ0D0Z8_9HYPO|nr:hypothetical protein QQS21_000439 [Conoideocrella luteorostrata]
MPLQPLGLPAELLLMILEAAPDLPSLYALICTHPVFSRLFEHYSIHIIQRVIERSFHQRLQAIPRLMVVIGSLRAPQKTSFTFPESAVTLEEVVERYQSLEELKIEDPLSETLPLLANTYGPRYALVVASRIQKLEDICLVQLLDNFNEADIAYPDCPDSFFIDPSRWEPLIHKDVFKCTAALTPSWVERQRVRQALWHLMATWNTRRFFTEILNFQYVPGPYLYGCDQIFRYETGLLPEDIVGKCRVKLRGGVIDTVCGVLKDIMGCCPDCFFLSRLKDGSESSTRAKSNLPIMHQRVLALTAKDKEWTKQPQPRDDEQGVILGQNQANTFYPNYATALFLD